MVSCLMDVLSTPSGHLPREEDRPVVFTITWVIKPDKWPHWTEQTDKRRRHQDLSRQDQPWFCWVTQARGTCCQDIHPKPVPGTGSPACLPALSYQTSPDLGSTLGSALGEGHRQVGACTEVVTQWDGVRDTDREMGLLSLERRTLGDPITLSAGLSGAGEAKQGQTTLREPGEDRPVATC